MAVRLAVACDVFDGVLFCVVLVPPRDSWMRSETESSQFLRTFLYVPTFTLLSIISLIDIYQQKKGPDIGCQNFFL